MPEIKLIIRRGDVSGVVQAPSSKSYTHRAFICSALASGTSNVKNPLSSVDTLATLEACKKFGVDVKSGKDSLEITGVSDKAEKCEINCKESGSTMRFLIPVSAVTCKEAVLTGYPGLLKRPVGPIVDALKQLGVQCESNEGFPPVTVKGGEITGGKVEISGNVSSQFISGLLFTLPMAKERSEVVITTELESKNYVLMTLEVLREFGINVTVSSDMKHFLIPGNQKYKPKKYVVEGDYSSAAFLFAIGVLSSENGILIKGLKDKSLQGDSKIVNILKKMGAEINYQNGFRVGKSNLKAIEIDAKDFPDLVPILAVVATQAEGKTVIKNVGRLRIKESDRLAAITSELKKMGAEIKEGEDYLEIVGPVKLKGATIDPYGDHRIAMACSIAGLVAEGDTIIENPTCIKKSYPRFFDDMRKLGADVTSVTNSFGEKFNITVYGESHGKRIGVVIKGCPKIEITPEEIQKELDKRRSRGSLSTSRREKDQIKVISGIIEGKTTGGEIKLEIDNKDVSSKAYDDIKDKPRPGHADYTGREKYASVFDYRGGGFFSGRMTACMVMAGAIAKKILSRKGVKVLAYTKKIGGAETGEISNEQIEKNTYSNEVKCPEKETAEKIKQIIEKVKSENDSIGGEIECRIIGMPVGVGEPIFSSVESVVSHSMFSIPAVKGIEFGSGFKVSGMKGSENNDAFTVGGKTKTNNAGGILGGITDGMSVVFRIAVKPTASIGKEQTTIDLAGMQETKITVGGRHDPCIVIRAVPVVESMAAISILDLMMRGDFI